MVAMIESQSVAEMAGTLHLLPHPVVVHGMDRRLLLANDRGHDLLGAQLDASSDGLPWEHPELERDGPEVTSELTVRTAEGARRRFVANSSVATAGDADVIVTSLVDVTRRYEWSQPTMEGVVRRFELSWSRSQLPVFLVRIDEEGFGRVLISNPALDELCGPGAAPAGRHLRDLFDLTRVDDVDEMLRDLVGGSEQFPMPGRVRGVSGRSIPALIGLTVAQGADERPLFVLGYAIDQSEMAAAEAARHRDLVHTELIYEFTSDVVAVVSADGHLRFVGPSSLDVMGLDRQDLVGSAVLDLIHPDDVEPAAQALEAITSGSEVTPSIRLRVREGTDSWRHVEVIARNLLHVPEVAGIVATVRDRSGEVSAEAEMVRSERQVRALLAAMPDMVVRLSADGVVLDVNNPEWRPLRAARRVRRSPHLGPAPRGDRARRRCCGSRRDP